MGWTDHLIPSFGSAWTVTDDKVEVELEDGSGESWFLFAVIFATMCVSTLWSWMHLEPLPHHPLYLVWTGMLLAAFAAMERREPTLARLVMASGRVELQDSDGHRVVVMEDDDVDAETEHAEWAEGNLWQVKLSGPSLELETPYTNRRRSAHELTRAIRNAPSLEATGLTDVPTVTCPKRRTYGAVLLILWAVGWVLFEGFVLQGEPTWWEVALVVGLLLPFAAHGLSSSFRVRLRTDADGRRMLKVGLLSRWHPVDELFIGIHGSAIRLTVAPRELVNDDKRLALTLRQLWRPAVYPLEGVADAFTFARRVRGVDYNDANHRHEL